MINLFIILFILIATVAIIPIKHLIIRKLIIIVLAVILIFFAGFREDIDRDYIMYSYMFKYISDFKDLTMEPTFTLISSFIKTFSDNKVFLFLFYAILGISLKIYAITKLTEFWFLSILLFFCNIYIIQDLTQIRASIGSGLLLISLIPIVKRNFVFFCCVAFTSILFHYSSLIILFFWLFDTKRINVKLWVWAIPMAYVLFFLELSPINLYKLIPIETVQAKVNTYILMQKADISDKVNIFSVLVIIRITFIYFLLFNIQKISKFNQFAVILLKIYIMSVFLLILMASVITLSLRLNEFLSVAEFVLIPLIFYCGERKLLYKIIILTFSCILLFFHIRSETLTIFI